MPANQYAVRAGGREEHVRAGESANAVRVQDHRTRAALLADCAGGTGGGDRLGYTEARREQWVRRCEVALVEREQRETAVVVRRRGQKVARSAEAHLRDVGVHAARARRRRKHDRVQAAADHPLAQTGDTPGARVATVVAGGPLQARIDRRCGQRGDSAHVDRDELAQRRGAGDRDRARRVERESATRRIARSERNGADEPAGRHLEHVDAALTRDQRRKTGVVDPRVGHRDASAGKRGEGDRVRIRGDREERARRCQRRRRSGIVEREEKHRAGIPDRIRSGLVDVRGRDDQTIPDAQRGAGEARLERRDRGAGAGILVARERTRDRVLGRHRRATLTRVQNRVPGATRVVERHDELAVRRRDPSPSDSGSALERHVPDRRLVEGRRLGAVHIPRQRIRRADIGERLRRRDSHLEDARAVTRCGDEGAVGVGRVRLERGRRKRVDEQRVGCGRADGEGCSEQGGRHAHGVLPRTRSSQSV